MTTMHKPRRLSEKRFEARLARLLERRLVAGGGCVVTFHDACVLTLNCGLVVSLPNGQEFQLTIVDSTRC